MINNSNRTEWSPLRSVIVRVTNEITRSFDLFDQEYDNKYDNRPIGWLENLLQINRNDDKICYILGCARDVAYCPITVKPRYNEEPRDWQTLFAITKFCYIEVLYIFYFNITKVKKIVRYTKNLIKYRRLHLSAYTWRKNIV